MSMRRSLKVTERRKVASQNPESRPAHCDVRLSVNLPASGGDGLTWTAISRWQGGCGRLSQPVSEGRGFCGATQPIAPFQQRRALRRKVRADESVVRVTVIPRFASHLHFQEEPRGSHQAFLDFRGNFFVTGHEREPCLPAKLPRKKLVIQGLLAIASILRKLR